jgi:hypothetical protein
LSESLRNRFEPKVDRSSKHHVWTGSSTSDGAGKLKGDGKTVSARRVAWELARSVLAAGVVVKACRDDQACVRVEHLSLRGEAPAANRWRAPRGTGSKTQIRPRVWKVTVTSGRYADWRVRRLHRTVQANTEIDTTRELAAFVAEVRRDPLPHRR